MLLNTAFVFLFPPWLLRPLFGLVLLFTVPTVLAGSFDSSRVIIFDFNNHDFNESRNQVTSEPVGVSLVEDRFGNSRSAILLNGHRNSYLNLGHSPLLKPRNGTISLWINLTAPVYAGRGYAGNPVILTNNGPGEDFIFAYCLVYNTGNGRFGAAATRDSLNEALTTGLETVSMNRWYHVALTYNDRQLSLYINGQLQQRCIKNFPTRFLDSGNVWVGGTGSTKNERYLFGMVDDIQIFHRVLTDGEIDELYHAPDPQRKSRFWQWVLQSAAIATAIFLTALLLVWRRRRALRLAREKLDLQSRLHEMEIRTLKAQMNPHFIFNALNSIRQLIMRQENAQAEQYLVKFSKLIRELLETNTRESLSLAEEISILNGYLEMESLRFAGSFHYTITAAPELEAAAGKLFIPHLLVQPFAENAIWHGLLPVEGERQLQIAFYTHTPQTLLCVVTDNGRGRTAGHQAENTFKKQSLALSLVQQRLQLFADTLQVKCGVTVTDLYAPNGNPEGIRVEIILPILKN